MERVVLATGNPDLDDALMRILAGRVTVVGAPVYYREALEKASVIGDAGVVILSADLDGITPMDGIIHGLRRQNRRIVLLAGNMDQAGLKKVRGLGVYDIVVDPVNPEKVFHLILHAATFADAEKMEQGLAGPQISSTFSAGLATGFGTLATMIGAAEQALYEAKRSGRNQVVQAGEKAGSVELVDRVASGIGEFTVIAALIGDGQAYTVTDARGPFAGQLMEKVVEIVAEDGVRVHSGSHWLFGLSGETVLAKRGNVAVLVGRRGRFSRADLNKLKTSLKGVL